MSKELLGYAFIAAYFVAEVLRRVNRGRHAPPRNPQQNGQSETLHSDEVDVPEERKSLFEQILGWIFNEH